MKHLEETYRPLGVTSYLRFYFLQFQLLVLAVVQKYEMENPKKKHS